MSVTIRKAEKEDVKPLAELALQIWHDHFDPIIGPDQVEYMVARYQSEAALKKQLESGYTYLLALEDGVLCGYCGFKKEPEKLFLSKLYLEKSHRGKGIASRFLKALKEEGKGLSAIYLTVNKKNSRTIDIYKHMGFETVDAVVTDIGGGFVMDDYIMELPL